MNKFFGQISRTLPNGEVETKEIINYRADKPSKPAYLYKFYVGDLIEFMNIEAYDSYSEKIVVVLKDFTYLSEDIKRDDMNKLIKDGIVKEVEMETLYVSE